MWLTRIATLLSLCISINILFPDLIQFTPVPHHFSHSISSKSSKERDTYCTANEHSCVTSNDISFDTPFQGDIKDFSSNFSPLFEPMDVNIPLKGTNMLTPLDLPSPRIYKEWNPSTNTTFSLPSVEQVVALGSIKQKHDLNTKSENNEVLSHFAVLPHVLSRTVVSKVLSLLHFGEEIESKVSFNGETAVSLDADPDSVDGMTSQEIFLDNDSLRVGNNSKLWIENKSSEQWEKSSHDWSEDRIYLRKNIRKLLDPVLETIITPFVRQRYKGQCNKGEGRGCTPCYSLIRRYRQGERISHAPHHDKHSIVTVVVSLSDYGTEYTGGLYVASERSQRYYIALNRGDAIIHQGDLLHGVQVNTQESNNDNHISERWSWILWYRDSILCEDHSSEWFTSCAMKDHNPTCQLLYATTLSDPTDVVYWNEQACENGHGTACVKLARAYLKSLPSSLSFNPMKAITLFQRAVKLSNEPDGHYGLAGILLQYASKMNKKDDGNHVTPQTDSIIHAILHLQSAALGGHPFAMFNLGIMHMYGYGYPHGDRNPVLAMDWFDVSGLPEGFEAKALYLESIGRGKDAKYYHKKARIMGYGTSWRKRAREATGYGGAGGVDLNLNWPILSGLMYPQKW